MPSDNATLITGIHQRLNPLPKEPIPPDSSLYVHLYDAKNDPVYAMAKRIARSGLDSVQFLSGCRGAGKTTELNRLRHNLRNDGYVVFWTNIVDYINPAQPIKIETFLLVLAAALSENATDVLGKNSAHESICTRFFHFLNETKVSLTEFGFQAGVKDIRARFKLTLRETESFRQRIQSALEGRTAVLAQELRNFAIDIIKALEHEIPRHKGLVFIVDSLERLQNPGSLELEVMKSVEHLFTVHRDLLAIPNVHLVYTVPPWLRYLSPAAVPLELMIPCVKLWSRNPETGAREWNDSGWQTMRSVVEKRVAPVPLSEVFGEADESGRFRLLDKLIEYCGGHFRDLLRLVMNCLPIDDTLPTTEEEIVDAAIADLSREYTVTDNSAEWLKRISDTGQTCIPNDAPETITAFTRFLDNHSVLYFKNARDWYDVHPAMRENVEIAVHRIENQRKAASATPPAVVPA